MSAESAPLVTGVAPVRQRRVRLRHVAGAEVPRAGAVWGHVLIVDAEELEHPDRFAALLALPRRPGLAEPDLSNYAAPLKLESRNAQLQAQLAPRPQDRALLEQVVLASYASSEPAVCVHSDPGAATRAVLAVWGGQGRRCAPSSFARASSCGASPRSST